MKLRAPWMPPWRRSAGMTWQSVRSLAKQRDDSTRQRNDLVTEKASSRRFVALRGLNEWRRAGFAAGLILGLPEDLLVLVGATLDRLEHLLVELGCERTRGHD